uniref:Uncharacterized protein n=1 Tax=Wuchereria bancrofti TaxID=6293 RepID=A0AAF5PRG0_WUCBA
MTGKLHYMHVLIYKYNPFPCIIFRVISQLKSRVIDSTGQFCL